MWGFSCRLVSIIIDVLIEDLTQINFDEGQLDLFRIILDMPDWIPKAGSKPHLVDLPFEGGAMGTEAKQSEDGAPVEALDELPFDRPERIVVEMQGTLSEEQGSMVHFSPVVRNQKECFHR